MTKYIITVIIYIFLLPSDCRSVTWEKLYSKSGADCFRDAHELTNGDFFAAGYTNSQNSNDTDGLAIRFNDDGDRIWTYTYNASSNDDDGFYKGVPTSDGGFILCGFTYSSANSDNALYIKLNSSGAVQWTKNWGGTGNERARDIIELPGGKFISVGYTTSSPAQGYDMFILKLDENGITQWSELYGDTTYDEAYSVKRLSDGGFLMGGIGDDDFFIVRTDAGGNEVWSNHLGTSGVDLIKCLVIAPGGNGFALSGTTTGVGAGGEDAYLVRTDSGGNQLWTKYFGGPLDDGFQGINTTSDGGYIGIGTSRLGPWPDPNVWLYKLDSGGNITWQRYYGGDEHDHGYCALETSDGGYIVSGHTRSFGANNPLPDAILIKTDNNGNVQQQLTYTTVTDLISPVSSTCGSPNAQIIVEVANYSDQTVSNIPVTVEITGAITQTLSQTYSSPVARNDVKTITFNTTIDMSAAGTYNFHCFTGNTHDVYPDHNYLDKSIVINNSIASVPVVSNESHCGPGSVEFNASSSHQVYWYSAASGGTLLHSGLTYATTYLTSDVTFYAEAGTTCPSARIPVLADITPGIAPPVVGDASRCDSGSVLFTASSAFPVTWYDSATSLVPLFTGDNFNTPSINSNHQYFVAAEDSNCSSVRISVNATINPLPVAPIVIDGNRCGEGSVILTASGTNTIYWFDAASSGTLVDTGNVITTPFISSTTQYFAQSYDGNCFSNSVPANANINSLPVINLGPDTVYTSQSNILLDAGGGFPNYLWSTSATSQTISVSLNGTYCVTVTDNNSCIDSSCIYVEFSNGIEMYSENYFNLFPSPSNGIITVDVSVLSAHSNIIILDIFGRYVYSYPLTDRIETLDLSFLSNGIYLARISDNNFVFSRKFTIE